MRQTVTYKTAAANVMASWGIFATVVIAVPVIALIIWIGREQASIRRQKKFLRRYDHRSVPGIRKRIEHERATEQTRTIRKVKRESANPLEGRFSGNLLPGKHSRNSSRER